jgi:hypothetical protein
LALQANVYKRDCSWVFHIVDHDDDMDARFDANRWTGSIEWTEQQLVSYPRVVRMAYDMWYFERKNEAEKFQILWLLKFSA